MKILWLVNIAMPKAARACGFCASPQGGWLEGQLEHLDCKAHQIVVCCCNDSAQQYAGEIVVENIRYIFVSCKKEEQEQRWLDILKRESPDVIHIFGTEYYHSYAMLKVADPKKVVVSIQGLVDLCGKVFDAGIAKEQLLSYKVPRFLLYLLKVQTVAQAKAAFLVAGRLEKESLLLAQNVIGRTHWDYASVLQINPQLNYFSCSEILRQCFYEGLRWNYKSCEPYTIFVSQASYPIKAFQQLLYALPYVFEKFPTAKVRISGVWPKRHTKGKYKRIRGCDEYQRYIETLIDSLDLRNKVSFIGNIDAEAMKAEFLKANVSVCCSAIENSSNSICEAQILGTPVVASYVGGTIDLIENEKTGYLYPFNETNMLAHYICSIFERKEKIESLSRNEVTVAMKRHDPRAATQELMSIYQKLCNERKSESSDF
jgi:glycosyltransferase involved in cell wall biosynthesis